MIKRVPGAGYALTLAVGLSAMIALSAVLVPRPSTLVFPVDTAGFSPASRPQSIQPLGASITPITSVAAGSSGISFSGDAYDVSCTVSAAAGTLYPAMHDGTNWTVYYAYPCALDGTVATKATCIFPARRGSGLTWNAFKTGAATINACTAEQRYTGGGLSAVPPPPASTAAAFDPASPGAIGGTTPAAGTFTSLASPSLTSAVGNLALTASGAGDLVTVNGQAGLAFQQNGAAAFDYGVNAANTLTLATGKNLAVGSNTLTLSDQLAASKLLIASQAAGDILYAGSTTAWSRLGAGSNGNVLTLASGVPSWAAPAAPTGSGAALTDVYAGLIFASGTGAVTAGQQYLRGPYDALTGTGGSGVFTSPVASLIADDLGCDAQIAPSGAETATFTVRKSTNQGASYSDTALTCTMTGAAVTCAGSVGVSLSQYDRLAVGVVGSAGTTATDVTCSFRVSK